MSTDKVRAHIFKKINLITKLGGKMSAFLGPIHYWLYNKIKIQHDIVENIISLIEETTPQLKIREKLSIKFGDTEIKPLEEVIDVDNIHGWLQNKISIEESRLAYSVTSLLNESSGALEDLKNLFKNEGFKVSELSENDSIDEIYKNINDTLLDGMPCDRASVIVSQDEKEILWKRNLCVHEDYWNSVGGDIENYYLLRDELIKGMLKKANATYEKLDEVTSIIRRR
jgi:hypothetical protein